MSDTKKSRSFKVKGLNGDKDGGRYTGDSPYQAANKALSEIIRRKIKIGEHVGGGKINFTLVESTKGSNHKEHSYIGKRIKLKKPSVYETKDGVKLVKKYKNELRKVKKSEM